MNVRGLRPGDDRDVERLFAATLVSGHPLPFDCPDLDDYADLCLGWYLGPGRDDVVVLEELGRVVGYALVCTDDRSHRRWSRPVASTWAARTLRDLAAGRYPGDAGRFYRLRLRDRWDGLLAPPPPCPAHLHCTVEAGHRGGPAGRLLVAASEDRLRQAGVTQWYSELDVPVGRRGAALVRSGARIVHRRPNRTLTWLTERPVERVRFTRRVGGVVPQSQPERRNARCSSTEAVPMTVSTSG